MPRPEKPVVRILPKGVVIDIDAARNRGIVIRDIDAEEKKKEEDKLDNSTATPKGGAPGSVRSGFQGGRLQRPSEDVAAKHIDGE